MKWIKLLTVLSLTLLFTPQAESKKAPTLLLDWQGGHNVSVCSSAGGKCFELKMPSSVGSVHKVVAQDFLPQSPLSWLAFSKAEVSLCTISAVEPSILCARIGHNLGDFGINVDPTSYGKDLRWVFRGHGDSEDTATRGNLFLTMFGKARSYLAEKRTIPGYSTTVQASVISDGSGCFTDDSGATYCDGGDGGGGGGDTGQIVLPLPPPPPPPTALPDPDIPVVIITGQPLSPASNPDELWYCRWFNVGCSTTTIDPTPTAAEQTPTSLPPFLPTPSSNPPDPIPRYAEGYEDAIADCQATYNQDMEECGAYFTAFRGQAWAACA